MICRPKHRNLVLSDFIEACIEEDTLLNEAGMLCFLLLLAPDSLHLNQTSCPEPNHFRLKINGRARVLEVIFMATLVCCVSSHSFVIVHASLSVILVHSMRMKHYQSVAWRWQLEGAALSGMSAYGRMLCSVGRWPRRDGCHTSQMCDD